MTSYSSSQLTALQGYISAAQNALTSYNAALAANNTSLATNDAANVVSALTSYYGAQTSIRGYATDALNVINNTGLFGAVANQEILTAVGANNYDSTRLNLMVTLAQSDNTLVQKNPNAVPTSNEIADYHYQDYLSLGLNPTTWGGASGASLGSEWSQGTLLPAEIDANLGNNRNYPRPIFERRFGDLRLG